MMLPRAYLAYSRCRKELVVESIVEDMTRRDESANTLGQGDDVYNHDLSGKEEGSSLGNQSQNLR